MTPAPHDITPLRDFVIGMTRMIDATAPDEAARIAQTRGLLATLLENDAWLPEACARPHRDFYQQYLLHCDPLERFSVVSFVWGPGQRTPVHDHGVWGLIGMLRGAEIAQRYRTGADGALVPDGEPQRLDPGDIDVVSPHVGDIHVVENAFADRVSVSIHVYGANIGAVRRHVFDPATGQAKTFVSGYSDTNVPNLWDRSAQHRGQP